MLPKNALASGLGRKLSALSSLEDSALPDTHFDVTNELISLSLLEEQLTSYIQDRRSRLLARMLHLSTKAAIDVLPPEILVEIFAFAVAVDETKSKHLPTHCLDIMSISHVCRQWRSLAFGTSSLWTRIRCNKSSQGLIPLQIENSRDQPLDLIFVDSSVDVLKNARGLKRTLARSNIRSVVWRIDHQPVYDLIFGLLPPSPEKGLIQLHLSFKARCDTPRPPWDGHRPGWCESLRRLTLDNICPSILPPFGTPELRSLCISYPSLAHERPIQDFRMSQLRDFISRAPHLADLAIRRNSPVLDINSVRYNAATPTSSEAASAIRTFTWTAAPPKDIWRLLHILPMPSLSGLVLCLDPIDRRWLRLASDILVPSSSQDCFSYHSHPEVIRLPLLKQVYLDSKDVDGLSVAVRKFSFPSLERLTLSYSGPDSVPPVLPAVGKIFREPRLARLVHLEVRHFTLDIEDTVTTLAYMPTLTSLSIYDCPGSGAILCALSGNACGHQGSEQRARPLCPSLTDLRLSHSATAKFKCLESLVRKRKMTSTTAPSTPARAIKPLRRGAFTGKLLLNDAVSNTPATPKRTPKPYDGPECASPNGSFVDGWRAHEVTQPSPIRTIHILGCQRISHAELLSLKDEAYGVKYVSWA